MKNLLNALAMVLLVAGVALGQESAPGSASNAQQIAPGASLPVELSKSLDAHKTKVGDPVQAKIVQDLLSNGQVVIPRDTKVIGHVTEATPKGKGEPGSTLGLAFDKMILKGGREIPFNATIQALAKPQQSTTPLANEPTNDNYGGGPGGAGAGPGSAAGRGGVAGGQVGVQQPSIPDATGGPKSTAAPSAAGAISASTQGVIGLKGLSLSKGNQGTVITSDSGNVHLDGGTQMILRVEGK